MELLEQTGDLNAEIDFRVRPENTDGGATNFAGFGYERLRGTIRATEDRSDRLTVRFIATADGEEILDATAEARIPGLSRAAPTQDPREVAWRLEGAGELPLEYIAPFLPGVVALTGQVSGRISGSGTVATPTLSGTVSVSDGELRTIGPTPPISAINGAIRFQGGRFFSEQFSAESGLSPFNVSVDGTLPHDGEPGTLSASLQGRNLLLTTSPLLRVRADADISLTGSLTDRLSLDGLITVRDGLYSQDIPLIDFDTVPSIDPNMFQLFSVQSSVAARTELNLRLVADETFRVENNLYQGAFSSDLTLYGTLEVPRPQGRVFTDSGRLFLPLTSLRIEQAVLRFPRDRPFTPDVQARGATRLRDYQLSVAVSGTLPGVEINVTTTPPLPQGDALVLLSTGFTPQELADSGNRAALAIGSRLGTQFVQSLVGTTGGDAGEDLADRVSVLLGEGVSESGAETIEIEFRLTEEDSWFLVFRRDRYERYNMDLAWRFWLD
jgi:translocation and assembly module TamB